MTGVPSHDTQQVYLCRSLQVRVSKFMRHTSSLEHLVHGVLRARGTQLSQQQLVLGLAMHTYVHQAHLQTHSFVPPSWPPVGPNKQVTTWLYRSENVISGLGIPPTGMAQCSMSSFCTTAMWLPLTLRGRWSNGGRGPHCEW